MTARPAYVRHTPLKPHDNMTPRTDAPQRKPYAPAAFRIPPSLTLLLRAHLLEPCVVAGVPPRLLPLHAAVSRATTQQLPALPVAVLQMRMQKRISNRKRSSQCC
jgi:hypothetical protein